MRKMFAVLAMSVPLFCGACAGGPVQGDYDTATDFSRLKTYVWVPPSRAAGDTLADNGLMEDRVRRSVDATLLARGFRAVGVAGGADFKVTYHYLVEKEQMQDQTHTGVGFGVGSGGMFGGVSVGMGSDASHRETETLAIDVLDGADNRLIWHGVTRRDAIHRTEPGKTDADVNDMVKAILAKFPPKGKH